MRSSDFDTHFRNDIWLADELRNYIANFIGIEPGLFHMNVGSLHRYKDYTKKHVLLKKMEDEYALPVSEMVKKDNV